MGYSDDSDEASNDRPLNNIYLFHRNSRVGPFWNAMQDPKEIESTNNSKLKLFQDTE